MIVKKIILWKNTIMLTHEEKLSLSIQEHLTLDNQLLLAKDHDIDIRISLAKNPHLAEEIQLLLFEGEMELVKNPHLIEHDEGGSHKNIGVLHSLIENPNLYKIIQLKFLSYNDIFNNSVYWEGLNNWLLRNKEVEYGLKKIVIDSNIIDVIKNYKYYFLESDNTLSKEMIYFKMKLEELGLNLDLINNFKDVVSNMPLNELLQQKIIDSNDSLLWGELLYNPSLAENMKVLLSYKIIQSESGGYDAHLLKSLLQYTDLSEEIQIFVAKSDDWITEYCEQAVYVGGNNASDDDFGEDYVDPDDYHISGDLIKIKLIHFLVKNKNLCQQAQIELFNRKDWRINHSLFERDDLALDIWDKLLDQEQYDVIYGLVKRRKHLDEDRQKKITQHSCVVYRKELASRHDLTDSVLQILMLDDDVHVKRALLNRKDLSDEILKQLNQDKDLIAILLKEKQDIDADKAERLREDLARKAQRDLDEEYMDLPF